jgi:hypothetical protein
MTGVVLVVDGGLDITDPVDSRSTYAHV